MAKKNKDKDEKKPSYSDYPIKTLFRVAILGGAVAFLLYYLSNPNDIFGAFFRAFLMFAAFAIGGGAVMIVVFYIIAGMKKREREEAEAERRNKILNHDLHAPQPEQNPPA